MAMARTKKTNHTKVFFEPEAMVKSLLPAFYCLSFKHGILMKSGNLYSAFLYEFGKIRDTEREVVSFLPQLVDAIADPQLMQILVRQREEAQCLLSVLANIKYGKKNAAQSKEVQILLSQGVAIVKAREKGQERDWAISAFAERVITYEIDGCSCLVSMAKKLGFEEEGDVLYKGLLKKEPLAKKLNMLTRRLGNEAALPKKVSVGKSKAVRARL
jgi:ferritin-like metal-binding protein YciE